MPPPVRRGVVGMASLGSVLELFFYLFFCEIVCQAGLAVIIVVC